jgi:nucleoid-associated protein YgaU
MDDEPGSGASGSTAAPGAQGNELQSFDAESPSWLKSGAAQRSGAGNTHNQAQVPAEAQAQPPRVEGKVDTILHRVERNENFWTISRMYYDSGRYYRALWKANEDKVPEIAKLRQNTVIRVPPLEDLDPAFVDPPGLRGRHPSGENLAHQDDGADLPARVGAEKSTGTSRRRPTPEDGVPIRRSSRSDAELTLPVADAAMEADRIGSRSAARNSRSILAERDNADDEGEPEIRPREAVSRPIYKVRPYDTLRTIARDTLSDSKRADEILALNRDIISDPSHLIVGQILELPEDARTNRPRNRR